MALGNGQCVLVLTSHLNNNKIQTDAIDDKECENPMLLNMVPESDISWCCFVEQGLMLLWLLFVSGTCDVIHHLQLCRCQFSHSFARMPVRSFVRHVCAELGLLLMMTWCRKKVSAKKIVDTVAHALSQTSPTNER